MKKYTVIEYNKEHEVIFLYTHEENNSKKCYFWYPSSYESKKVNTSHGKFYKFQMTLKEAKDLIPLIEKSNFLGPNQKAIIVEIDIKDNCFYFKTEEFKEKTTLFKKLSFEDT